MLFPLKVVGPINVLSDPIVVLGALAGAEVQLLIDGVPTGSLVTADGLSVSLFHGGTLNPGQKIAATQSLNGQTSVPTPIPETVSALPDGQTGIPPVVFLSGLHPCVDWIVIGGTIPGAKVAILFQGQVVGSTTATGNAVSVRIGSGVQAGVGDVLEAVQDVNGLQSPVTQSLPLSRRPGDLVAPVIAPPFECDMAVLVSGLADGVSLDLSHDGQILNYPFVGNTVWANLWKPARQPETFTAQQHFSQCESESPMSQPVGVNPAIKLPTPIMVGPICPGAPVLRIRDLRPGALVTVWNHRGTTSMMVGQFRAWATDCDVPMPPGWSNSPAKTGPMELHVAQSNCDLGSDTGKHAVEPLPGAVGQPAIDAPVECARLIRVHGLTPGAIVLVTSDLPGLETLSGAQLVTAADMTFWLYRPLLPDESIRVAQAGCNADASSPATQVAALATLPAPQIDGQVRLPHGGVYLKGLLVGARVHVFVDGDWATSVDVATPEMFVPLSGLGIEAQVSARQSLCTAISRESASVSTTYGEMKLTVTPTTPIERGRPTSITVTAVDADRGFPVIGKIVIGSTSVGQTGTAFGHTFALGAPPPATKVTAVNYITASIQWTLVNPPPQPPKQLTLSIAHQASAFFAIQSIQWSIERQELSGAYTLVASPTGPSVAITPPSNGQYVIYAEVTVADLVNGGTRIAQFVGNAQVSGLSVMVIVWSGNSHNQNFRLVARSETIFAGGGAVTVYYPVVEPA